MSVTQQLLCEVQPLWDLYVEQTLPEHWPLKTILVDTVLTRKTTELVGIQTKNQPCVKCKEGCWWTLVVLSTSETKKYGEGSPVRVTYPKPKHCTEIYDIKRQDFTTLLL